MEELTFTADELLEGLKSALAEKYSKEKRSEFRIHRGGRVYLVSFVDWVATYPDRREMTAVTIYENGSEVAHSGCCDRFEHSKQRAETQVEIYEKLLEFEKTRKEGSNEEPARS